MSTIGCSEFLNRLESWIEGEQDEESRAHTRGCANCRSLVEDLQAIERSGQEMGHKETEPPEHLWTALRAQLEREELIRQQPEGRLAGATRWLEGLAIAARGPALAGAYMAALVAVAFALGGPANSNFTGSWAQSMEDSTTPLSAQLDTAEQATVSFVHESDPTIIASLHQNLAIVDNDIALCEKSMREDPDNQAARDYLYGAYQQKADLLAQMNDRDIQ